MDYALRTAIDEGERLTLSRHQSTRYPDLDFADDIALFTDTLHEAELLLHKVENASKATGLYLNPSKIKFMHINPGSNHHLYTLDGIQIEKVEDFKYIGSYTNSQRDIHCRKAQAAVHALDNV